MFSLAFGTRLIGQRALDELLARKVTAEGTVQA